MCHPTIYAKKSTDIGGDLGWEGHGPFSPNNKIVLPLPSRTKHFRTFVISLDLYEYMYSRSPKKECPSIATVLS